MVNHFPAEWFFCALQCRHIFLEEILELFIGQLFITILNSKH